MRDFNWKTGPTTRQKWEAFYRLYRASCKNNLNNQDALVQICWNDNQLWNWLMVCDHGDIHYLKRPPDTLGNIAPKDMRWRRLRSIHYRKLKSSLGSILAGLLAEAKFMHKIKD